MMHCHYMWFVVKIPLIRTPWNWKIKRDTFWPHLSVLFNSWNSQKSAYLCPTGTYCMCNWVLYVCGLSLQVWGWIIPCRLCSLEVGLGAGPIKDSNPVVLRCTRRSIRLTMPRTCTAEWPGCNRGCNPGSMQPSGPWWEGEHHLGWCPECIKLTGQPTTLWQSTATHNRYTYMYIYICDSIIVMLRKATQHTVLPWTKSARGNHLDRTWINSNPF